ncbi:MAG: tRNA preQ1(34) S-adenosylmethionine ribosyltransferase-isomerase QueA [bacterium]|nr:tRNA preQ1(34) S-adenosylmethionine ribosyltransferase-isomerase QueA [bacterium]MDO5462283.1 tRNA preQ1(34) S-adenosylmethionine ribosyltransferase-isomerase QueA [bacterium]
MLTADFDYFLPEERIAQVPPEVRGTSRMMVLDRSKTTIEHRSIQNIVDYLRPGDLLILNNTRVFPARILGQWEDTAGAAEFLLLDCRQPETCDAEGTYTSIWRCMCGSGRKARIGNTVLCGENSLRAKVLTKDEEGASEVCFTSQEPLLDILGRYGLTPVPPYIRRNHNDPELARLDKERYQTIYAQEVGAVAAPTAGLHFTEEIFQKLEAKGIRRAFVTLHVGPGTFKPVKAERIEDHKMDAEHYALSEETARLWHETRQNGGRIIAVGSTTVRTLETIFEKHGDIIPTHGTSTAFIYPPYTFKAIDCMLTNFHLPQSTLIMMVSALAGKERILEAYRVAVEEEYRFFSYGDCMLIL